MYSILPLDKHIAESEDSIYIMKLHMVNFDNLIHSFIQYYRKIWLARI